MGELFLGCFFLIQGLLPIHFCHHILILNIDQSLKHLLPILMMREAQLGQDSRPCFAHCFWETSIM
jgi:hypothetical protein